MFRVWQSDEGPPTHSVPPHLVAKAAATLGRDAFERVHARCLHAYFAENRDISSARDAARDLARGRPARGELERVADPELLRRVAEEHNQAVELGVNGVPAVAMANERRRHHRRAPHRNLPALDPEAPRGDGERCASACSFPASPGPAARRDRARTLARDRRTAEDAGFASLWVMDHLFQIPTVGPAEQEMLEGYTTLAFLAGADARVRLGTLVTGVTYRHPGILIKIGDHARRALGRPRLARDRRRLVRARARGLGVPFPPLAERFERLEEACRSRYRCGRARPYRSGKHYQLAETLCVPAPLSRPRPPILIGGTGEKKTLRLVAQYADACNLFAARRAGAHKLAVLRPHCDIRRDYGGSRRPRWAPSSSAPGQSRRGP